jgi:CheY-like chemotaxis protein
MGMADAYPGSKMDHRHEVIVVDDDVNVRRLFTDALESIGAKVHAVSTGEEAMQLATHHPDVCVVLADMRMPRMDGWDLERALRRDVPDRLLSIRGGTVRDKPVAPDDIVALVRTGCRMTQLVR